MQLFSLYIQRNIQSTLLDELCVDYVVFKEHYKVIPILYNIIVHGNFQSIEKIADLSFKKDNSIIYNDTLAACNNPYIKHVSLLKEEIIPIDALTKLGIFFTKGCNKKCSYCLYPILTNKIDR